MKFIFGALFGASLVILLYCLALLFIRIGIALRKQQEKKDLENSKKNKGGEK